MHFLFMNTQSSRVIVLLLFIHMCICIYIYIFVELQAATLRFNVAHLCHLTNLEDPAQSELLDCILEQLPSDSLWNQEDMLEKAYSKKGLKRYRISKVMLDTETKETSDNDKITCDKNMSRKVLATLLDTETKETPDNDKKAVEHEFMELASNTLRRLNAILKRMQACIASFKILSAMMSFKVDCIDKELHSENIYKALTVLDKSEREIMYFRPQMASDRVQKMRKYECSVLIDKTTVVYVRAQRIVDASYGVKSRINTWARNVEFDKCESSDEGSSTE
jgi:hypothetical protein